MKAGLFRRRRLRACPGGSPSAPETSLRWGVGKGMVTLPWPGSCTTGRGGVALRARRPPPAGLEVLMAQAGLSMEKNLLKRKMQATRPTR